MYKSTTRSTSHARLYQMDTLSITERFDHLRAIVSSERFLKMQVLANEVPFFICPYAAEDAVAMQKLVQQLTRRLQQDGVQVLTLDLYDISVEILQQRGIWERILQIEATTPKEKFIELLQNVLDPKEHLINTMAKKMAAVTYDVLFLTGVGEVYPYLQAHNVLSNLQRVAKDCPTLMFFPGTYRHTPALGASLKLFDRLEDHRYYRATNIFDIEP